MLRQLQVTGTNAGLVLMGNQSVKQAISVQAAEDVVYRTKEEWFRIFEKGWFSSKLSTEAMMRASAKEQAVLSALRSMPFIKGVSEVGMAALQDYLFLARSPDRVSVLDRTSLMQAGDEAANLFDEEMFAGVEIKTRVAASELGASASLSSLDQFSAPLATLLSKNTSRSNTWGKVCNNYLF